MSGSLAYSQTGIPATITIVPGPAVGAMGALPGRGYTRAAIGADGHLRLQASDGTIEDVGLVVAVIGRVAPAGVDGASAAPLITGISIAVPGVVGGGLLLAAAGRFEVINRSGADVPVYPLPGAVIEQGAQGVPVTLPSGSTSLFTSPDALAWVVS